MLVVNLTLRPHLSKTALVDIVGHITYVAVAGMRSDVPTNRYTIQKINYGAPIHVMGDNIMATSTMSQYCTTMMGHVPPIPACF